MPAYLIGKSIFFEANWDATQARLTVLGEERKIAPREARLLLFFCRHPGREISFQEFASDVFQEKSVKPSAVHQGVTKLRELMKPTEEEAVQNIRARGYLFSATVRRIDEPRVSTVSIPEFSTPQRSEEAEYRGLGFRQDLLEAFFDKAPSCHLRKSETQSDYRLEFEFLLKGPDARLAMQAYRRGADEPISVRRFEAFQLDDPAACADMLERLVILAEADILLDKWRLVSADAADWDEQTVEALLNPLYAVVDGEAETIKTIETSLRGLSSGAPHLSHFALAALSILYSLWARQTIDRKIAENRNAEALALAREAMRPEARHPLSELALARAERLAKPESAEDREALLARLERICAAIPGNVMARATYVSALLDEPSRREQAFAEVERLRTMYPYDPAQSMAMTVVAKARAMERDVLGVQAALEEAVLLAETSSPKGHAPPFLRFALAVFYRSAAKMVDEAAASRRFEELARSAIRRFRKENEGAAASVDSEFLLRQLYLAPGWMQEMVSNAAQELQQDVEP